jgi:hypothetical protein
VGVPKAYLKYIFFNKAGTAVDGKQQLLPSVSNTTWQPFTLSCTAPEDGYLQVMVVNESAAPCGSTTSQ